jgi:hypothetical protein
MHFAAAPLLAMGLWAVATLTPAADWKPIQGTYAVTPENYLDPPDAERKDSHVRFQLTGRSARDLFAAMKVAPTKDDCTGGWVKRVGDMTCSQFQDKARHECSFSIDVMKQKIEYGLAC